MGYLHLPHIRNPFVNASSTFCVPTRHDGIRTTVLIFEIDFGGNIYFLRKFSKKAVKYERKTNLETVVQQRVQTMRIESQLNRCS